LKKYWRFHSKMDLYENVLLIASPKIRFVELKFQSRIILSSLSNSTFLAFIVSFSGFDLYQNIDCYRHKDLFFKLNPSFFGVPKYFSARSVLTKYEADILTQFTLTICILTFKLVELKIIWSIWGNWEDDFSLLSNLTFFNVTSLLINYFLSKNGFFKP